MKFIKDKDDDRRDYIFKKDKVTLLGARFVSSVLVILIILVVVSYFYFN